MSTHRSARQSFSRLLRFWRQARKVSQAHLAFDCDISTRHLSFLENGRTSPSQKMVLVLAQRLHLPPGDRNSLLLAAGFAPVLYERKHDDPEFHAARALLTEVLRAQEPSPALAYDRHWNLVEANRMVGLLLGDVAAEILTPPVNLIRLVLDPRGLAPRIEDLPQWHHLMLTRLRKRQLATGERSLLELEEQLSRYTASRVAPTTPDSPPFAGSFRLRSEAGTLSFLSTTMVFGTPLSIDLPEIAVETFLPADEKTRAVLRDLAAGTSPGTDIT